MNFSAMTDIGKEREHNEDSYGVLQEYEFPIYIIADGMGGHQAGDVASAKAVNLVKEYFIKQFPTPTKDDDIVDLIKDAIKYANATLYKMASDDETLSGMGTTIDICIFYKEKMFIGHIGDSRVYKIRDDNISQITNDHSVVAELLKNGTITEKEAKTHPQRNYITRALATDKNVEVDIYTVLFEKGDKIVMCTDGLTNMISDDEIKNTVIDSNSLEDGVKMLIDKANDGGGTDNITVMVIER